jgi:hypothetical protein
MYVCIFIATDITAAKIYVAKNGKVFRILYKKHLIKNCMKDLELYRRNHLKTGNDQISRLANDKKITFKNCSSLRN